MCWQKGAFNVPLWTDCAVQEQKCWLPTGHQTVLQVCVCVCPVCCGCGCGCLCVCEERSSLLAVQNKWESCQRCKDYIDETKDPKKEGRVITRDVLSRSAQSGSADMGIFPLIEIGNFERGPKPFFVFCFCFLMTVHNLWQNADAHVTLLWYTRG